MKSEEKIGHDFVMIWYWLGFVCSYIKLILKRKYIMITLWFRLCMLWLPEFLFAISLLHLVGLALFELISIESLMRYDDLNERWVPVHEIVHE